MSPSGGPPFTVSHVVFDVDGTLVDFLGAREAALEAIARQLRAAAGLEVTTADLQSRFNEVYREPEWRVRGLWATRNESLGRLLRDLDVTNVLDVTTLGETYATTRDAALRPYEDVITTLEALRGAEFELRAASNGNMDLGVVGLDRYFAAVELAEDLGVAKPDPAFFTAVATRAGAPPEAMLLVGDRIDNDYVPARAAGMHALLIDRRGAVDDPEVHRVAALTEVIDLVRLLRLRG